MNYPILEFDPKREAFVEPSKIIKLLDVPEHCVVTFISEVIDKVVASQRAKLLVENRRDDGPHPLYEIDYKGQRLAFSQPGIAAALSAASPEEVIALGYRKFIACGGAGVLEKHFVVLSGQSVMKAFLTTICHQGGKLRQIQRS